MKAIPFGARLANSPNTLQKDHPPEGGFDCLVPENTVIVLLYLLSSLSADRVTEIVRIRRREHNQIYSGSTIYPKS
jgi:hypothetical protein